MPGISKISRIGYQDDQYIVGPARHQLELWQEVKNNLQQDGHTLRENKCKTWFPALEDVDELVDCGKDLEPSRLKS